MRNFSKENVRQQNECFVSVRASTVEKRVPDFGRNSIGEWIKVGAYKYREKDFLGKGFSSNVYCSSHLTNQTQKFAIKVIDLKKLKPSNLPMLDSQIKVHKALDHPNIIKCYDVYKTRQFYFIVMEYCPHGNLHQLIRQKKIIQQEEATQIISQIIEGYKYLIYRGVLHRDLKPANIMKLDGQWKIGDFGFSVFCKQEYLIDSINVGTPLYMPPESLRSNKYSSKTDIFSIGVILFQILAGKTPWESKTQKQLLVKMKKQSFILPHRIKCSKIIQFIEKSCQLDQFKRLNKDNFDKILSSKYQGAQREEKNKNRNQERKNYSSTPKPSIPRTMQQKENQKQMTPQKQLQLSTENSEQDEKNSQYSEICKQNTEKINFQLFFCQKVHEIVKKNHLLLLQKSKKDFFILILLKYLVRSIKNMQDLKMNPFNLRKWDSYSLSKQYLEIYSQIKLNGKKYEKEYLQHLKNTQIPMIRRANRKFPQLSYTSALNSSFYLYFKSYIVGVLKMFNDEIEIMEKNISCFERYYQTLAGLYNYYLVIAQKSLNQQEKSKSGKSIKQLKAIFDDINRKVSQIEYQQLRENIKLL